MGGRTLKWALPYLRGSGVPGPGCQTPQNILEPRASRSLQSERKKASFPPPPLSKWPGLSWSMTHFWMLAHPPLGYISWLTQGTLSSTARHFQTTNKSTRASLASQQVIHPEVPAGYTKHKQENRLNPPSRQGCPPAPPPPETPELAKYTSPTPSPQGLWGWDWTPCLEAPHLILI